MCEEIGYISVFDKALSGKDYEILFPNNPDIMDEKIKNTHINYENAIIEFFEYLFKLNKSVVEIRLYYIENSDLGIDEDYLYDRKEKQELKILFSSLSGKEIFYGKHFQLKTKEELKVILKLQLRTSRTIDFFFKELDLFLKGSYEYMFTVLGDYNEEKIKILSSKENVFYKGID
jgi:hypothetical protein